MLKNMVDHLYAASEINDSWSKSKIIEYMEELAKQGFKYDWDYLDGEMMITLSYDADFCGYICAFAPLVFIKSKWCNIIALKLMNCVLIQTDDFDNKEWYVNPNELHKKAPQLDWIANETNLNLNAFSIEDFWFATV